MLTASPDGGFGYVRDAHDGFDAQRRVFVDNNKNVAEKRVLAKYPLIGMNLKDLSSSFKKTSVE